MNIDDLIKQTKVEPRDYQKRVIQKTLNYYLEDSLNSVMIESPCGSGKTVMSLLVAKYMQQEKDLKVVWISQRKNLLNQAKEENFKKRINADIEFISMFDKNPPKADMLIVDEAQHDACNSCAHIHNSIKPKYILGMSGTPFRADKVKLCFDKIVKDAGIASLIKAGYLSQYHHYTIETYSPESIAKLYAEDPKKWGKTVAYFHTIKQCMEAQEILDSYNIPSEVVTGSSDRDEQIEMLEQGDVNVLLNCLVLTEGFNYPALQTVFVKPSCKGITIQMAGRVFRKHKNLTKNVIQCKKTKWPMLKTALPSHQYIREESEWRSIGCNDNVERAHLSVVKSLAKINATLPDFLTKQQEKKKKRYGSM